MPATRLDEGEDEDEAVVVTVEEAEVGVDEEEEAAVGEKEAVAGAAEDSMGIDRFITGAILTIGTGIIKFLYDFSMWKFFRIDTTWYNKE